MAWSALTTAEIAVGKPITNTLLTKVKDDLDYLYGQAGSAAAGAGVANGSFEVDSDADGTPDTWTAAVYSGGTKSLQSTQRVHGDYAMSFVHPGGAGNGGGSIQSDYILVANNVRMALSWSYYCSAAGMKCIVQVDWYNAAQENLATETLYTSTTNPTAWARKFVDTISVYAGAYYAKFKFILGYTDTDVAGTAYLDDVRLSTLLSRHILCGAAQLTAATEYGHPNGDVVSTTELWSIAPCYLTIRNLYVTSFTYTTTTLRKNQVDTALAVTATGSDLVDSIDFAPGDKISLKLVTTQDPVVAKWGMEVVIHSY